MNTQGDAAAVRHRKDRQLHHHPGRGEQLYYKDWGPRNGPVVVFSHGWPLSSDSWQLQMIFLAARGYRVVAHDRRGHGRSSQPWEGNDMDHYADDLATVIDTLDLEDTSHPGRFRPAEAKLRVTSGAVAPVASGRPCSSAQ